MTPFVTTPFVKNEEFDQSLMVEFGILFDGYRYVLKGFAYEDLVDAINQAKLLRLRPELNDQGQYQLPLGMASKLSVQELEMMDSLLIRRQGRKFVFGGYRYDQLDDAVEYAKTHRLTL